MTLLQQRDQKLIIQELQENELVIGVTGFTSRGERVVVFTFTSAISCNITVSPEVVIDCMFELLLFVSLISIDCICYYIRNQIHRKSFFLLFYFCKILFIKIIIFDIFDQYL